MSKSRVNLLVSFILFFVSSALVFDSAFAGPIEGPYVPGEVIIKYAEAATSSEINTLSVQLNSVQVQEFSGIGASLERLVSLTVPEAIALLENNPLVEYIEPNYLYTINGIPNDPDFAKLWGMHNTGQTGGTVDADIDAPEAWSQFTGSNTVIVGVIDSGVDYNHPDLAANIWTNPGEIPNNGIDDDGNGFIDDIHGWDFYNSDSDPMDDNSHGTHVSGTIGGVGNNGIGVVGVNWNVKIMALKFLSAGGSGSTADAIGCVEYATMMGARLTSNSWGGGAFSTPLEDAIANAYAAGVLFVASAGNSGSNNDVNPSYPASYTLGNIVAVGATDHNDDRVSTGTWSSSFGLVSVDIGAPGLDVFSTEPNNSYGFKSGTSMAAPHVSGVLALVIGQFPGITVDAARTLIFNSADVKPQLSGLWATGARINAVKALTGPDSIPPLPVVDLTVDITASNWISLVWTATGDDGNVGNASSYDLRVATFPIDATNFDTATAVANTPFPAASGQPDSMTVAGLEFQTSYYFALKARDEYGNASPISNISNGTTLGIPTVATSPGSLSAALITGEQQDHILTISNTGAGTLDFEVKAVKADSTALAMQAAAAAVVDGITPSGTGDPDEGPLTVLTTDEVSLLRSRLTSYDQAGTLNEANTLPVIGVGGTFSAELMFSLLNTPQLTGLFTFLEVNYEFDDLTTLDGLIISETDHAITESGAIVLNDFFNSGRGIFLGMDDFDDIWFGALPGLLEPVFGIANPTDANLCSNVALNPNHPITDNLPAFVVGGSWCNDNDSFQLNGADWLFTDATTGGVFGTAYEAGGRSVLMGETLAGIWEFNLELNANAVIWMMAGGGIPSVSPAAGTIPAGGSLDIAVTFDASNLCGGNFFADVVITSNDPVDPEVRVPTVMAVTGEPDIGVSTTLLDYGQVFVGAVIPDTLVVSNPGCDVVDVTSVSIDHADFSTDLTPFSLQVGEQRLLVVHYNPSGAGPAAGTLSLTSNDPGQPVLPVSLAAEALVAPIVGVSPASVATNLLTGEIDTQLLTISNSGGNDLVFAVATEDLTALGANDPVKRVNVSTSRLINAVPAGAATAAAVVNGLTWADGAVPLRNPLPAPVTTIPGTSASLAVLVLGNGDPSEIQTQLLAFSDIAAADYFDTDLSNPTLADLVAYQAVILINTHAFNDPFSIGNVLADYVDQGGGVVQTLATFADGFQIAGRFIDEGYAAFNLGVGPVADSPLGNFDAAHPIMDGVSAVEGALLATAPLAAGAQWVADWAFGEPFVATQGDQVVGVNIFLAGSGYWTGDLPLLLHNAIIWSSGAARWLTVDPTAGTVAPGASIDLLVTLDASEVCGGTYVANILVDSNDPLTPQVAVPVEMIVTGEPDIAVSKTLMSYGPQFIGAVVPDTLYVSNPGCDLLQVTAITVDHGDFSVDLTPFDLLVGESRALAVVYSPTSVGPVSATLSLTSNVSHAPLVTVALTGEGLAAPAIAVTPNQFFVNLVTGEVITEQMTIANTGGNDLVWSIQSSQRDSLATIAQTAAAVAVTGIFPSGTSYDDDGAITTLTILTTDEQALLQSRLADYRNTVTTSGAADVMPLIGVGGSAATDMLYYLMQNSQLTGLYTFIQVYYEFDDLTALDGLVISENDANMSAARATVLRDFYDSGRGIVLGMDDLDSNWIPPVSDLLAPVLGISAAMDANFCSNAVLNSSHPINDGITEFFLSGAWCNDNDHFALNGADWLVMDGSQGLYFGVANAGHANTVTIGEGLSYTWIINEQFNANAVIWMMSGTSLPQADPAAGVIAAGASQVVTVTFDASDICGGNYLADLLITNNDPLNAELIVPADMHVSGEPDIAVSDTMLAWGQVFIGAVVVDSVLVSNPGCDLLTVTGVSIDHADFITDTAPFNLQVGEERLLLITYTPSGIGPDAGTLSLISNDPDEPLVTVAMTAEGIAAPAINLSPTQLTANLVTGEIETQVLTIENTGGSDLVWDISVANRDSLAIAMQAAAAAVVAGITPSGPPTSDGGSVATLSAEEQELLQSRLVDYQQTVAMLGASDTMPLIGVGGSDSGSMIFYLMQNFQLTSLYTFTEVFYEADDLSNLHGLVVAENDANITVARATALRDFHDSGRGIVIGMDDFDSNWFPPVSDLLAPMLGVSTALDGDFCGNGTLNTSHPINDGITEIVAGGWWCSDNDFFTLNGADWLFTDGTPGHNFGVAYAGLANTVTMGENLAGIWLVNEQFNVNAVIWAFEGQGLPQVDPAAGVLPAGGTQLVNVTFDASDVCGGDYLANLVVASNDPLATETLVPADMIVIGEPDIAVSDTLLAYGLHFIGAVISDTLVITNPGCDLLQVTAITIDQAEFSVDTTPFDLAIGESRILYVTYTPTSVGLASGTLSLTSNVNQTPVVTVSLTGEGLVAPVIGVSPSQLTADLLTGEIDTQLLTLSNTGGNDLIFEISTEVLAALGENAQVSSGRLLNPTGVNVAGASVTKTATLTDPVWHEGTTPLREALPAPTTTVPGLHSTDMSLLIIGPGSHFEIQAELLAFSDIVVVDIFDAGFGTPTLAELSTYHAVILSNYNPFLDPIGLGNVLADYVDQGGGVVQSVASFVSGLDLQGRFIDEGYAAFHGGIGPIGQANLASFDPNHPIMAGINSLTGDALATSPLTAGTQWVADWSNGEVLVATQGERVAGVNLYVASPGYWTGDGPLLLHNAAAWVANSAEWLGIDPTVGTVAPGAAVDLLVTFDASGICGGTYAANVLVSSNDPLTREVVVPANLTVTGEPDIAVSDTLVAFGPIYIGVTVADTVMITNPGCELLTVRPYMAVRIQDAGFNIDTTHFDLQPGESRGLEVTYAPTDVGVVTGEFTLASNDPNEPAVLVHLSGEGVTPPAIAVDPKALEVTLITDEIQVHPLTITNTGGADLIWSIRTTNRDSVAALVQAAAAVVVEGITPSGALYDEGGSVAPLSVDEQVLLQSRLLDYQQTVSSLDATGAMPLIGVGGGHAPDMIFQLLQSAQLASLYTFTQVNYEFDDLTNLDGLIVSEPDAAITVARATVLADFYDSGRGLFIGMDDFDSNWFPPVSDLLGPVLGMSAAIDLSFCANGTLNTTHPINEGIPGFQIGGWWCSDNDYFTLNGADWLFTDGVPGRNFGIAYVGTANTVTMGEALAFIWTVNEQLNTNAVIWMMEGAGLPAVSPDSGIIAAGGNQIVEVTFDATTICGGDFLADLTIASNDPLRPGLVVAADMHVIGAPIIGVADSLLAFGTMFIGTTATDTVTISNSGCAALAVTAVTSDHGDFSPAATAFTVPVDGTYHLPVTFTPSTAGPALGVLTLTNDDPLRPIVTVTMTGEGLHVPIVGVTPTQLAADLDQGETEVQMLTIANSGAGELTYSISTENTVGVGQAAVQVSSGRLLNPAKADLTTATDKIKTAVAATSQTTGGFGDGLAPLRGPYPTPTETVMVNGSTDLQLLLLGSGELAEIQAALLAYSTIAVVDVFAGDQGVPTLAELMAYNVVILANNYPFLDPVGIGNVLADYVDVGGGVIQTEASFVMGFNISGRFMDQGYAAFGLDTGPIGAASLGTFDSTHAIMAGVTAAASTLVSNTTLAAGAQWIADWDNGRTFVATNGNQVVGVNAFVARTGFWDGDVDLVLHNAVQWIVSRVTWLEVTPMAGIVPAGGSVDLLVTFDTTNSAAGVFQAAVLVSTNDPATPLVTVPVALTVHGAQMNVNVAVSAGAFSDLDNTLGIADGATDGFDGLYDVPEPPAAPAGFVSAYFHHPEWASPLGDRFMTDIRASYDPATAMKSWPFVVRTDQTGTVTVAFTPSFAEASGWQLWLRDEATGGMHNLFPSLTYTFTADATAHAFTIFVGEIIPPLDPAARQITADWSLLGVPLVPTAGADTWSDVVLGATTGTAFLYDYQGASGYAAVDGSDAVTQGQGVWLGATDTFTWTMQGEPDGGTIEVPAMVGWNLVGYPLWIGGSLDGVSVAHAGQLHLWQDAVALGLVSPFVYDYDGDTDTYLPVNSLEPWHGYWMAAHTSGVTLQFNYRAMLSLPAAVAPLASDPDVRLPLLVQATPASDGKDAKDPAKALETGWQLNVTLSQGGDQVAIGRTVGATNGFDAAFDLPVPPASPSSANKATLVIRHPEWDLACGSGFYSDMVALSSEPQAWNLTLTTPEPGTVTLYWDALDLPAEVDLQVYLPYENRVVVMSVRGESAVQIEVGTSPVEIQLRTPDNASDVPDRLAGLQLRNAPNPFNPQTEFRFNLPRAGEAEIRIFDLRGAVVRRVSGGVMPAGPGSLRWAGRDNSGRTVASGIYFYRLYLDQRQEGTTIKMTLVK